jgi:diaminohydroxyphosphoribosylaminopyrimidine deaminase/5-amino-6-(5-phosphoribosylamino)uracil reductase
VGVLAEACRELNAAWFHFIGTGRPYVTLKLAATLDGRIATRTGDSRWVTGPEARQAVHQLRDLVDAVLVGRGTALADDPRLTTRLRGRRGRDPLRVVLDTRASLPPGLRLFRQRSAAPTVVAHAAARPRRPAPGVELLRCRRGPGGVDLRDLLRRLAARGVVHLMVEGGAGVAGAFLSAHLVDQVHLFLSPRVLGQGLGWSPPDAPARMAQALRLGQVRVAAFGEDLLVSGTPALADARRRV